MGFKVVITSPAIGDLIAAVRFIADDNKDAAVQFGLRLVEKAESLSTFPERGRRPAEPELHECREIILEPYRIIYRVSKEKNVVEVLRFWHGARGRATIY